MVLERKWQRGLLALVVAVTLVACGGDDDDRPGLMDSGVDSGTGGGTDGGGGGGTDAGDGGGGGGRVCSIAGGACDVILQNCPQATQGCYIAIIEEGGEPTTFCSEAGTADEGEACDPAEVTGCLPGFGCSDDRVCRRYCCEGRASDCAAGSGQLCTQYGNAMPLGICELPSGCGVVPQSGCEAGEGCVFISMDGSTDCRTAGSVAPGGACGAGNLCQAGSACVTPPGGTAICAPICRMDEDGDCADGMVCGGVDTFPETHGVCVPMPSGS